MGCVWGGKETKGSPGSPGAGGNILKLQLTILPPGSKAPLFTSKMGNGWTLKHPLHVELCTPQRLTAVLTFEETPLTWLLFNSIDDPVQGIFQLHFIDRLKSFGEVLNGFTDEGRKQRWGHQVLIKVPLFPNDKHSSIGFKLKIHLLRFSSSTPFSVPSEAGHPIPGQQCCF